MADADAGAILHCRFCQKSWFKPREGHVGKVKLFSKEEPWWNVGEDDTTGLCHECLEKEDEVVAEEKRRAEFAENSKARMRALGLIDDTPVEKALKKPIAEVKPPSKEEVKRAGRQARREAAKDNEEMKSEEKEDVEKVGEKTEPKK